MRELIIRIWKKIKSVSIITYLFVAFLIWLLIFAPFDTYEFFLSSEIPWTETPVVAQILAYVTIILFIMLLLTVYFFAFPLMRFVLVRGFIYLRLFFVAFRLGFKIKNKRLPLASLFGLRIKEDICIKNKENTFCIHFIDVIGRARVFSIINENEYNMARTVPAAPQRLGAAYYGGATGAKLSVVLSSTIHSGKTKKFPSFDENNENHIIILDPLPMEVRCVDHNVAKPLYSGYSVGNITYYETKDFIKLLKRT